MNQRISLSGNDWQLKGFVGEDWLWRQAHLPESRDSRNWKPAQVPGSVQNDLWQAGEIPDPYREMNSLAIEWVPERTWLYRKRFTLDPSLRNRRVQLVFRGVDYSARYFLNGEELGRSEGMFLPAAFEVSQLLNISGENHLVVVIEQAPFEQPQVGYTSKVYTQKARMNYCWDFCPRMIHLGIWDDVYLSVTGPVRIDDVWVHPILSNDFLNAAVKVKTILNHDDLGHAGGALFLDVALLDSAGIEVARQEMPFQAGLAEIEVQFELINPALWWPNGAGSQPLYSAVVSASVNGQVSDHRRVDFGLRKIEFIQNEDADPQSLPYTLVANGRRLYIKGWNWVPIDVLYGAASEHKRMRLLELARRAHINLLRVWGGGLIEREAFYKLCDSKGILVWQEFVQSSSGVDNVPSEDHQFIDFLVRNAGTAIRYLRNHPSLAIWCGGNELHYSGTDLCNDSHPALAALKRTVNQLDPGRHWLPSSPSGGRFAFQVPEDADMAEQMHDVHGPWEFQGLRGQYQLYNKGESLLHSEFGAEGLTNQRTLDSTIEPERQWPVSLTNPIWEHLGSWWVKERQWSEVFGLLPDVAAVQRATQFLQADGLRYALEADRRRKYHNSGTLPWQFNEPYPMAACTSSVDYYGEPKPVYYAVGRAYQPLTLTAQFDTLAWGGEAIFRAEIWCSNSGQAQAGELAIKVVGHGGQIFHQVTCLVNCEDDRSHALQIVEVPLTRITGGFFFLDLVFHNHVGQLVAENRYLFSSQTNLSPLMAAPPAQVHVAVEKEGETWTIVLKNSSQEPALWIWLEAEKKDLRSARYAYFSNNYFCLLPNEQRVVSIRWDGVAGDERAISITGWNITGQTIR